MLGQAGLDGKYGFSDIRAENSVSKNISTGKNAITEFTR